MRNIRVATVQMEHAAGDKAANFLKIEAFVERAAAAQVEILVLPECCITGYWFLRNLSQEGLELLAERVPEGESTRRLLELSRRHGMTIGAGLVEIDEQGRMYNTYVVAMPDGEVRRHRTRIAVAVLLPRVLAVDRHLRAATATRVRVDELDLLDHAVVAGQIDRSAALTFAEHVLEPARRPAFAIGKHHGQILQLDVGVGDDERELVELALAPADLDRVAVALAGDLLRAEQCPAGRIERRRSRRGTVRLRGRDRRGSQYCNDKAMQIGSNGVQLLGGHGFVKEHPVERWYRDLRSVAVLHGGLHA